MCIVLIFLFGLNYINTRNKKLISLESERNHYLKLNKLEIAILDARLYNIEKDIQKISNSLDNIINNFKNINNKKII